MDALTQAKFDYLLYLADSSLILGHRLSEWCGHGPVLEEDIALINVSLDLIGLSRNLYTYAATLEGKGKTEDDLAYLRDANQFRNALLTEQPNQHFGFTIMRQFLFDAYADLLYRQLQNSKDEQLAAIAAKAVKEMDYHLRHSGEWVIRLGDGTDESHEKMQDALEELWMFTGDLFEVTDSDKLLTEAGIIPDAASLHQEWMNRVKSVCDEATLKLPAQTYMQGGSRKGLHTEHLGFILAEMQFLQRAYPGNTW
jgi:ring-1,2-phenylacetyl-CoA epoxidase subunit PaaC